MTRRYVLLCAVLAVGWYATLVVASANVTCPSDKLAGYKVVLHTFWSRDRLPKHYPEWRPAAQWSKLVGRSHDKSFVLFRVGNRASTAVKSFAETGRSDVLEDQGQGSQGIYDEFVGAPIRSGAGRTEADFFVDGNHSRVSLMSKITPSPDWFIGIDSFDLCVDGNWIDSITIEVDPLDAGTDNGFTFTAPNWPTEPPGIIYRMSSRYPSHPAGSFYYPYMKRLPPIATFQFIKLKEYELTEVFHHTEDDRRYDLVNLEHVQRRNNAIQVLNNNDIEAEIEDERQEQERHLPSSTTTTPTSTSAAPTSTSAAPTSTTREAVAAAAIVPRGDKDAILNSIAETYRGGGNEMHRKKYRGKPRKNVRKIRPPRDCRVAEWSAWGECSKSCGIGEMQRRRDVLKHARRGGRVCPPLVDVKWCGSARACSKGYFNW